MVKQLKVSIIKICMCSPSIFLLLWWSWMRNVLHIVVGYRLAQDFLVLLVLVQHWVSWLGPYWLLHWLDLGQVGTFTVPLESLQASVWTCRLSIVGVWGVECIFCFLYIDSQHIRPWCDMLYLVKYMMLGPHYQKSLNGVGGVVHLSLWSGHRDKLHIIGNCKVLNEGANFCRSLFWKLG